MKYFYLCVEKGDLKGIYKQTLQHLFHKYLSQSDTCQLEGA